MAGQAAKKKNGETRPRVRAVPGPQGGLWIGGKRPAPVYVGESSPYRPDLVLWIDAKSGFIFDMNICPKATPKDIVASLKKSMDRLGAKPDALRVDDPKVARLIETEFPGGFSVTVGETPELDGIVEDMGKKLPEMRGSKGRPTGHSYLEYGRVGPEMVRRFFEVSGELYETAPWKTVMDGQVLGIDIPGLGVEKHALSIIGNLGESLGFMLFESFGDYEEFEDAAKRHARGGEFEFSIPVFSVNFDPAHEVPKEKRDEALKHGWPLPAPDIYPVILAAEEGRFVRPLAERDYLVAILCCAAVTLFYCRHKKMFEEEEPEVVTRKLGFADLPGEPVVWITAPYGPNE